VLAFLLTGNFRTAYWFARFAIGDLQGGTAADTVFALTDRPFGERGVASIPNLVDRGTERSVIDFL
jgi:hypothetical protein